MGKKCNHFSFLSSMFTLQNNYLAKAGGTFLNCMAKIICIGFKITWQLKKIVLLLGCSNMFRKWLSPCTQIPFFFFFGCSHIIYVKVFFIIMYRSDVNQIRLNIV
ncbi:hypothetical protein FKM82_022543 [Ascaphus truei]